MIYIVSGFPRSGTSMLMQACEAGGMQVVRSAKRDQLNRADGPYLPNPESLYEPTLTDMRNPSWWREQDDKVVKCVVPWIQYLPVYSYSVVFLLRDPEEIRQSFRAAFENGLDSRPSVEEIEDQTHEALLTLANRRDVHNLVTLRYREDVLTNPACIESLGWPIDPIKAVSIINPNLCRFRRESLVVGL